MCETDCATPEGMLRIIQLIPWLVAILLVGHEKIGPVNRNQEKLFEFQK